MNQPTSIEAQAVSMSFGETRAVDAVDLAVERGTITAVIGPNGCGKSTLLRAMGRLLTPDAGRVLLDGRAISELRSRDVARRLGILPQSPEAPGELTVIDLVSRGRDPHRRWFDQWSADDEQTVLAALRQAGILELADRSIDTLSGGQRQRAWIAMALAQETDVLLLDEPTTFLDVVHQIDVLELVTDLHRTRGTTVVMVLHDLAMAARFAGRLVAMRDGRVVADGSPADVLTPDILADVFELDCDVLADPRTGAPLVVPIGRVKRPARPGSSAYSGSL